MDELYETIKIYSYNLPFAANNLLSGTHGFITENKNCVHV